MGLIETQREQAAYDTGFDNGKDYWQNELIDTITERLSELEAQAVEAADYKHAWLYRRLAVIVKDAPNV